MLSRTDLIAAVPDALLRVELPEFGERHEGKVRDYYVRGQQRILVTTDRVSAFDRVVGVVPYKGQVLNQLSAWWFGQLASVVPSHLLCVPDPNVTIAREAKALPVEVVVRGHITGSTSTSLWTLYSKGVERPYGLDLPKGLAKNDPLPHPVVTPTTKAEAGAHDERVTEDEIVSRGLVSAEQWHHVQQVALSVFEHGRRRATSVGLVLVDTKYEFGLIDGNLALIDEVHTPDCSRYWTADGLESARKTGAEPENYDKEYLRLWFARQGYKGEGPVPSLPDDFVADLAARYIWIYERLTGRGFEAATRPAGPRIRKALETVL